MFPTYNLKRRQLWLNHNYNFFKKPEKNLSFESKNNPSFQQQKRKEKKSKTKRR